MIRRRIRQLVDQATAGVDELGERGGGPVGNERLVQRGDVRFGRRAGERGGEACGVVPGGAAALWEG